MWCDMASLGVLAVIFRVLMFLWYHPAEMTQKTFKQMLKSNSTMNIMNTEIRMKDRAYKSYLGFQR